MTSDNDKMFGALSAFYLHLWEHVDAFFDDSRWLRVRSVPEIECRKQSLNLEYKDLFCSLNEHTREPTLAEQISRDFQEVKDLIRGYEEQKPERGSQWFRKAEKTRSYLQELGIRYAELALSRPVGGQG